MVWIIMRLGITAPTVLHTTMNPIGIHPTAMGSTDMATDTITQRIASAAPIMVMATGREDITVLGGITARGDMTAVILLAVTMGMVAGDTMGEDITGDERKIEPALAGFIFRNSLQFGGKEGWKKRKEGRMEEKIPSLLPSLLPSFPPPFHSSILPSVI